MGAFDVRAGDSMEGHKMPLALFSIASKCEKYLNFKYQPLFCCRKQVHKSIFIKFFFLFLLLFCSSVGVVGAEFDCI